MDATTNGKLVAHTAMLGALALTHPDKEALLRAYMQIVGTVRTNLAHKLEPDVLAIVEREFDSLLTTCGLA